MAARKFGRLYLFEGPMCSGKSTELVETYTRMEKSGKHKPIAFAPRGSRDATIGRIQPRTGISCSARFVEYLGAEQIAFILAEKHDAVFIDEAQFFTALGESELFHFCDELMMKGIDVHVAALDTDYLRKPWSGISLLRGLSPKTKKMKAYCTTCKNNAVYTLRLSESQQLVDINAKYEPACRSCYYEHQTQLNKVVA